MQILWTPTTKNVTRVLPKQPVLDKVQKDCQGKSLLLQTGDAFGEP